MFPVELFDDVSAKSERDTAVRLSPAPDVGVGICPQNVAQEARVRHVRRPQDTPNLLHAV
jgi:hypothetical protein